MGWVKAVERGGKRRLMGAMGRLLRARPVTVEEFRRMRFGRILVVRQHHQMGDMMLAVPALRALRETYPGARIGVVTSPLNRGILIGHPYVDRVFTYQKYRPLSSPRLVSEIRRERYELVIVLHTVSFSFTTLVLGALSGAPVRVGSTSPEVGESLTGTYLSLTLPLPPPGELDTMSEAEHNLYPLRSIGITTDDLSPLMVPEARSVEWARAFAREHWKEGAWRIAVHPGAGKSENIWPAARFAEAVDDIARSHDVSLIAVEGPRDRDAVSEFTRLCGAPCAVAAGRRIGDVAALLRQADLVICNDTGVMHVAAAAGARTLAIFGSTDPVRWAPPCDNLHVVRSPQGELSAVTPQMVVERATALLRSIAPAEGDLQR